MLLRTDFLFHFFAEMFYLQGYSLIEQYRKRLKSVNLLKRNLRYMSFTKDLKLDEKKVTRLLSLIGDRSREERESIRRMHEECGLF